MVSAAPVWFTMLVQFVVAMVATISFGITFQVGRRHYWTCGFVGRRTAVAQRGDVRLHP